MPIEPTSEASLKSFQEMTQRERAVAVARDVIKTVTAEGTKIQASHVYFESDADIPRDMLDKDLRDCLPLLKEHGCRVCVRGAAVLSHARLFNDIPADAVWRAHDYMNDGSTQKYIGWEFTEDVLKDTFSRDTRNLMEAAFECDAGYAREAVTALTYGAAIFGSMFRDDTERLVAVMQNIIDNDGEFVVEPASYAAYTDACFIDDEDDFDFDDDDDDDDDFDEIDDI